MANLEFAIGFCAYAWKVKISSKKLGVSVNKSACRMPFSSPIFFQQCSRKKSVKYIISSSKIDTSSSNFIQVLQTNDQNLYNALEIYHSYANLDHTIIQSQERFTGF